MKTKKTIRFLSLLLSTLMLLSVFATASVFAADTSASKTGATGDSGDLEWNFDESTGVLMFLGNGKMADYEDETERPWHSFASDILAVAMSPGAEKVGKNAFYDCENLKSVSFSGNAMETIGDYAFAFTPITEFISPSTVTTIGDGAFYRCDKLTKVILSNNLTTINPDVFLDCPIKFITFTDSIQKICTGAFRGCEKLESIHIPSGVVSIEEQAFAECPALESITVDLNNIYYYDGGCNAIIDATKDELIIACNNTVIPSNVKSIAAFAFEGLTGVKSIDLPDGMTEISDYCFRGCTGLTKLEIPAGVTKIGDGAFDNCENVSALYLPSSLVTIGNYAFNRFQALRTIYYTGTEEEYNELYKSENGKYMGMGNHYYLAPDSRNHYYNYDPNHTHEFNDWFVWRWATMNADGTFLRECSLCGIEEEKAIPQIKSITLSKKSYSYTGKAIKPAVVIKDRTGNTLVKGVDYNVSYSNNKAVGKATAKIRFTGEKYYGVEERTFTINKAKNPMTVKASKKTVSYSKVSKAKQTVKKAITVKKAKGKVTYSKVKKGSAKQLSISKKGDITVNKGTKKGTYKLKVKVAAKGDESYKPGTKTVTVVIIIK